MAFAAGVFSLVAGNPVVTGTIVSSTWANNTLSDIATGLSTCVLKDGTQTTTAVVPFAAGISIGGGANLTVYSETTWTPVLKFGGTSSGIAFLGQAGRSTRNGREVLAEFSLALSTRGSGSASGIAVLSGFPFASSVFLASTMLDWNTMSSSMLFMAAQMGAGLQTATIKGISSGAGSITLTSLTWNDFAETTTINGTMKYTV